MFKRRRFKQTIFVQERLTAFASEVRKDAVGTAPGIEREKMLERARLADTALHLQDWANSAGLRPPK